MADVFISYSQRERHLTQGLAGYLTASGYSVWWDTDLLPSERFRIAIDQQLTLCRAAVIIWTEASAASDWVIAEAQDAHGQRKLINTHGPDFQPRRIPKPFNTIHSVEVTDIAAIVKAVDRLVKNQPPEAARPPTFAPTQYEFEARERESLTFIADVGAAMRAAGEKVLAVVALDDWENVEDYPGQLRAAALELELPLRIFRERLPFPDVKAYKQRRLVENLDDATSAALRIVRKELTWLARGPSSAVVMGARGDLSYAVNELLPVLEGSRALR